MMPLVLTSVKYKHLQSAAAQNDESYSGVGQIEVITEFPNT